MTDYDRPKLVGRFIKKGDPINKVLAVQDFSLIEICESDLIYPDNPEGNIIHHALHDQDVITRVVKEPVEIIGDFRPENAPPIMKPLDFTTEWKAMKKKARRKGGRFDEDEEYELELEMMENRDHNEAALAPPSPAAKSSAPKAPARDLNNPEESVSDESHGSVEEQLKTTMSPAFKINRGNERETPVAPTRVEEPISRPTQAETPVHQQSFVPMNQGAPTPETRNPELEAIEAYKKQLVDKQAVLEREKEIIDEARHKAFEVGYKEGEEKGVIQAQKNYAEAIQTLGTMVHQLQNLKKDVLANAQENFLTICQSMIEALLEREFAVNPSAFSHVILRAIKEAVPEDRFKILVNSGQFSNLKNILPPELVKSLVASDLIKENSFKIESDLTVIDGNIQNIVRDLLSQADLQLFDTQVKAS